MSYNEEVKYFINVFYQNFKNRNIDLFIKNIQSLKIDSKPTNLKELLKCLIKTNPALYMGNDNTILLIQKDVPDYVIYHELFHMASTFYKNNVIHTGFRQGNLNNFTSIGKGLNEGYTQLLKNRYFGETREEYDKKTYLIQQHFAFLLEYIIGKKNMEDLYLTANLPELIRSLTRFKSYDEIIDFICDLDYINNYIKKKKTDIKYKLVSNKIKRCSLFLLDCFIKKMNILLTNNEVTKNEFDRRINYYISLLNTTIEYNSDVYVGIDMEDVDRLLYYR